LNRIVLCVTLAGLVVGLDLAERLGRRLSKVEERFRRQPDSSTLRKERPRASLIPGNGDEATASEP
jgi:hypothetical protein